MVSIALKTELWYIFATDRQKNHSGYFYILHIQLNGPQQVSREHPVHGRCPLAVTWGSRQGGQVKWAGVPWAGSACAQGRGAAPRGSEWWGRDGRVLPRVTKQCSFSSSGAVQPPRQVTARMARWSLGREALPVHQPRRTSLHSQLIWLQRQN